MDPEKARQRVGATEAAAGRIAAAAGVAFAVKASPTTATQTVVVSDRVRSELSTMRNPGADDSEWILTVTVEGSPAEIGEWLQTVHAALGEADEFGF